MTLHPLTDKRASDNHTGKAWDALYRRGFEGIQRSPAEVDSVPIPENWGTLPASEWEANAFLVAITRTKSSWIDLGCGTGSVTAAMLRRNPKASAMGVDSSSVAIERGHCAVQSDPNLSCRLQLVVGDIAAPPIPGNEYFDLAYALFSLQFLRPHEVSHLLQHSIRPALVPQAVFAGTVRSVHRSIPASYERPWPEEPYTFVSHEPHERGLIYHHYNEIEIEAFARILGGRLEMLKEKRSTRAYDPAPVRSWWDFVIVMP